MEVINTIKKKISSSDRKNMVYFHPIASIEQICKYISAFSNTDGGNIVFGVKDDGNRLLYKKSVFNIVNRESEIRDLFSNNILIEFGSYKEDDSNIIEYINVKPVEDLVTYKGKCYMVDENNSINEFVNKNIFLSYCQVDSCIADILEEEMNPKLRNVNISRDIRDVKYKESFTEFMHSIGTHDFVISIISDKYLKSRNCMYEIIEVMRDRNFNEKLLFITISDDDIKYYKDKGSSIKANIYSLDGHTEYIMHWKNAEDKIKEQIRIINDPMHSVEHSKELTVIKKIQLEIVDFMSYLRDRKGITFNEMFQSGFNEIIQHITRK